MKLFSVGFNACIVLLTYGADILVFSINQNGHLRLMVNFVILLGFAVGLFALSL